MDSWSVFRLLTYFPRRRGPPTSWRLGAEASYCEVAGEETLPTDGSEALTASGTTAVRLRPSSLTPPAAARPARDTSFSGQSASVPWAAPRGPSSVQPTNMHHDKGRAAVPGALATQRGGGQGKVVILPS
ncbi:hypothetical protein EYF80_059483 [Liparis tanakae]|uniref:Uncharacterized protein n=1 Tax=Liparis tanakae TaxID=230148 RepID=A0A4Z2EPP0_9TELE|nr:hypothetical protein EYF80_059483 [Liparis tanakae]